LQALLEQILEARYSSSVNELPPGETGDAKRMIGEALRLHVSVAANRRRTRRIGALEAIFAEMDPSEIESIAMGNRPREYSAFPRVMITFDSSAVYDKKGSKPSPVSLAVAGDDRQWVGGAFDTLRSELRKATPRWAWMRSFGFAFAIGSLAALGIAGLVITLNQPVVLSGWVWIPLTLTTGLLGGAVLGAVVFSPLLERMFPAFEVLEPGSRGRSSRAIASIGTALSFFLSIAGIVLGVLAL